MVGGEGFNGPRLYCCWRTTARRPVLRSQQPHRHALAQPGKVPTAPCISVPECTLHIKPRLPGATDTKRPTTALAAASSSAIGVGGAGIASAAHPLDMPTGEALSKVQSHGRRETRAELSNAKATFEARMANNSGTRVTEPDSLFEDQRRFHRHTKSSGGRVR